MFQHGKNGTSRSAYNRQQNLMFYRATEQAEGGKIVGVDPTVITACTIGLVSNAN